MLKYLTDFLKALLKEKPAATSPTLSWQDILKIEEVPVSKKRRRIMLLPSKRVLLWRTEEGKDKSKKKQTETGLNFTFQFDYEETSHTIRTMRPFCQNLVTGALPKVSALMQKKAFGTRGDSSNPRMTMKINENSELIPFKELTCNDFEKDIRIKSMFVNGEEFEIVRNGNPIHSVSFTLTPMVARYCMPAITFNSKDTPVTFSWFISNELHPEKQEKNGPSKRDIDSLKLSFVNENERVYSLEGYTFRCTASYFSPEKNDVDRLVAVVVDAGRDYPVHVAISSRTVIESPKEMITDEQVEWCKENPLSENETRVMSYNILADLYLNLNKPQEELFFKYCQKVCQRLYYRTPILLKQLHDFIDGEVSIIFLQELDTARYENFIKPFLGTVNYGSEMTKKLRDVHEGVAVIFDRKKFRSIYSNTFSLAGLVETESSNEDVYDMLKISKESLDRFVSRPTIVQIVMLEDLQNGTIVICANTHLHHNPLDEHVKILQALVCHRKIMELFKEKKRAEPNKNVRILFGGDFNSTPDGPVFQLFSNGFLSKEDKHWKCDENMKPEDVKIDHKMDCLTGTPEYTNYTADSQKVGFVGCLDYIWGMDIDSVRVCPMPDHGKVVKYTALPSPISPSDHLPIICDIKL